MISGTAQAYRIGRLYHATVLAEIEDVLRRERIAVERARFVVSYAAISYVGGDGDQVPALELLIEAGADVELAALMRAEIAAHRGLRFNPF
jgi:hypothetical protein